ncbi:hypothetical protein HAX54_050808 [Datura stramonium]|uniref:Uncharacterized protein n=1 Tax=Datura stramonium TaxID=4076 RepID=A0ABS8WPF1_DATST|nr:hypothetical protein [Datura stramonium]
MGPSGTTTRRRSTRNSRTTTTTSVQKKKMKKNDKEEIQSSTIIINSPCKSPCKRSSNDEMENNNTCSTPKAERFRIPEMKTCPPAPKKRRIISSSSTSTNCHSLRRGPVTFFAPPDLDLFFFLALGDHHIPV